MGNTPLLALQNAMASDDLAQEMGLLARALAARRSVLHPRNLLLQVRRAPVAALRPLFSCV